MLQALRLRLSSSFAVAHTYFVGYPRKWIRYHSSTMADYRVVPRFLTPEDTAVLKRLSAEATASNKWVSGRQETQYYKYAIDVNTPSLPEAVVQLIDRTLVAMGAKRRQECKFDAYLLSYPTGSLIPAHTDVLDREKYPTGCHRRFNAVVQAADAGGQLHLGESQEHISLQESDAIIFHPDRTKHSVSEIEAGQRLVWSVGCVVDSYALPMRSAYVIGVGEVGKKVIDAMTRCGWSVTPVRRHDTEGWDKATSAETAHEALRILAMREEDLAAALERFRHFPARQNMLLLQNGLLESLASNDDLLRDVSRGLIYFTAKGSFFSVLTDSLFYPDNDHINAVVDSLRACRIAARAIRDKDEFTIEMIKKVCWNSIVGLPLHVHQCSLGDYLDKHEPEARAIIEETFLVCLRRYGLNVQNTKQLVDDTWNMVVSTTQSLRSMKRTGVAVGLAARNAAVLRWGSELALPTPVTAQLLDANRNN